MLGQTLVVEHLTSCATANRYKLFFSTCLQKEHIRLSMCDLFIVVYSGVYQFQALRAMVQANPQVLQVCLSNSQKNCNNCSVI